jgi:PII-like signaling protein
MKAHGKALQLTVYVEESAQFHRRPVYTEVVHRAHQAGLAGASVLRGIEGFGSSSHIHTQRILSLHEDLPVAVVVVDDEERVRAFLPQLDEVVTRGLVTLSEVEVVSYAGREADADG